MGRAAESESGPNKKNRLDKKGECERKRGGNKKNWCEIYLLPKAGRETETETRNKSKKKRRGTRKISGPVVFFVGGEWKVKNLKGHKLINH